MKTLSKNNASEVLEQLYQRHGQALRCYLLGRAREAVDLDDVVQEVFSRLARNEDTWRRLEDHRKDRAYIFQAANNLMVDLERRGAVRRAYVEKNAGAANEAVYDLSPEAQSIARQELARLRDAIMNLKPTWRKAFTMSRFEYRNYRDIAMEMGVSVKQVEKYIANALKVLRTVRGDDVPQGEKSS